MAMFVECWGRDFNVLDLSQAHIDLYFSRRRALTIIPPGHRLREDGNRRSPRLGDVPLFPAPADPSKPIHRDRASKWLRRAEALAKVPKFTGGLWHPYRRLGGSERKHLPDRVVAEAGGWRDTRSLNGLISTPRLARSPRP